MTIRIIVLAIIHHTEHAQIAAFDLFKKLEIKIISHFQNEMTLPVQEADNTFWVLWLWHWNQHRSYFAHFQTFRISFMSHFKCMNVICLLNRYLRSRIRPFTNLSIIWPRKSYTCSLLTLKSGLSAWDQCHGYINIRAASYYGNNAMDPILRMPIPPAFWVKEGGPGLWVKTFHLLQ